mmetsp:Transcript_4281/g.8671  ORF Transcript_4281/g.8671 Transcript_4281/m.8671 type:complete len:96 (-) Transcript_4281:543-830(-)
MEPCRGYEASKFLLPADASAGLRGVALAVDAGLGLSRAASPRLRRSKQGGACTGERALAGTMGLRLLAAKIDLPERGGALRGGVLRARLGRGEVL